MNRRGFLGKISLGAAALVAAPIAARLIDWEAIPSPPPVPRALNTSYKWYTGYDSFTPPTSAEVLDAAEFQWRQLSGFVSISNLERSKRPLISFADWDRQYAAPQQYLNASV